jgi:hypothetical protein
MQSYLRIVAIAAGLAVAMGLALAFGEGATHYQIVMLGSRTFYLEVASTPELRLRGLRGRTSLAQDGGLLVRLDVPAVLAYSTRYTTFPVDCIFFDGNQNITGIVTVAANDERPTAASSGLAVSGAVLVHGGIAQQQGLTVGSHIDLGRPPRYREEWQ